MKPLRQGGVQGQVLFGDASGFHPMTGTCQARLLRMGERETPSKPGVHVTEPLPRFLLLLQPHLSLKISPFKSGGARRRMSGDGSRQIQTWRAVFIIAVPHQGLRLTPAVRDRE